MGTGKARAQDLLTNIPCACTLDCRARYRLHEATTVKNSSANQNGRIDESVISNTTGGLNLSMDSFLDVVTCS